MAGRDMEQVLNEAKVRESCLSQSWNYFLYITERMSDNEKLHM